MKYLPIPIIGLGLIHILCWFNIAINSIVLALFITSCIVLFSYGVKLSNSYIPQNDITLFEIALSRITGKSFILILLGSLYFMFTIIYSTGLGGVTKVENGKFYVREKDTLDYYEIAINEYNIRQTHQVRAISGGVLFFSLIGYGAILTVRSSNKSLKQDK